jgi:uncharacterized membrane protein YkvA (DUF1232 family)
MKRPELSPEIIINRLRKRTHAIGISLLYSALLMFYAWRRDDTPAWAKRIVVGAFVYLFAPIDAVPDLAPIIGYTDDLGVLAYGLVMIAAYINHDIRTSARQTLNAWIGQTDESVLHKIDQLL